MGRHAKKKKLILPDSGVLADLSFFEKVVWLSFVLPFLRRLRCIGARIFSIESLTPIKKNAPRKDERHPGLSDGWVGGRRTTAGHHTIISLYLSDPALSSAALLGQILNIR